MNRLLRTGRPLARGDAPSMTLPVLIVGSGALASFFAARLAATDASVTMLGGWPEGVAALQTRGVCLVDANGGERCFPVRATADPSSPALIASAGGQPAPTYRRVRVGAS